MDLSFICGCLAQLYILLKEACEEAENYFNTSDDEYKQKFNFVKERMNSIIIELTKLKKTTYDDELKYLTQLYDLSLTETKYFLNEVELNNKEKN